MSGRAPSTDAEPGRARWLLATLPLAPLALLAYTAAEWLFFVTKPSVVSVLPFSQRLLVLVEAPLPVLAPAFLLQVAASLVSLVLYPRLRWVAAIPAAALLSGLVLVLTHNFMYVVAGMALRSFATLNRIVYAVILIAAFAVWLQKLAADLPATARSKRKLAVLWVLAAPALIGGFFFADVSGSGTRIELPVLPAARRPNILILSIDGVDAQRLSAYGYRLPTTPFLESLRERTLFCENAFSNANQTHTSQVSLLTGKLPFTTRIIIPPSLLQGDDAFQHLPGILRRSGYRSLHLSMRHFGDAEDMNVREGFDLTNYRWENALSTPRIDRVHDLARPFRLAVVDRLESLLSQLLGTRELSDEFARVTGASSNAFWRDIRRVRALLTFIDSGGEPWFAHVHLLDTHVGHHHTRGAFRVGTNRYDNLLRDADDRVREVFEGLAARRQLDRTIVVVTSDHGSDRKFIDTPRIPLLIWFPRGMHARHERNNVQGLDVDPTLLDYAGAPRPHWLEGTSLLQPSKLLPDRPIFATGAVGLPPHKGLAVDLPRPPNYGARTAVVIVGSFSYELEFGTGELQTTAVDGHTRPSPAMPPERARQLITEMLARHGFDALRRP